MIEPEITLISTCSSINTGRTSRPHSRQQTPAPTPRKITSDNNEDTFIAIKPVVVSSTQRVSRPPSVQKQSIVLVSESSPIDDPNIIKNNEAMAKAEADRISIQTQVESQARDRLFAYEPVPLPSASLCCHSHRCFDILIDCSVCERI